jgi:hypothetical protein
MNGEIIYYGVPECLECLGVKKLQHSGWDELRIERVRIPHMLHLLRMQGLPISSMFLGEIRCDGRITSLASWMLAKCSTPLMWEVPHYLRNIVLVKGDNREQTMLACVAAHSKPSKLQDVLSGRVSLLAEKT